MISLATEMTDSESRHARGWLFFDAECEFCTRIAMRLVTPMHRRGMAVAPLQDPRVGALLGLPPGELLSAIRFVSEDGTQHAAADAVLAVSREFWWARPLLWLTRAPGMAATIQAAYRWVAHRHSCPAEH
jgi:predicted DCC family thiol-disulfide oxidoreductase YuxK